MAETALTFGPDWIRAYSASASSSAPSTMPIMSAPKYKLADHRYGREEMLALVPKNPKFPNCLSEFPNLVRESFQLPMALIPMTEDEQRLWTRVNSDVALRQSGKTVPGMGRTGRGGSVDRGRGRGRGGYYQRGLMHDDPDDGLHGFSRPKTVERSLSANERDPRWDDRDRRYDRPFTNRGSVVEEGFLKQDNGMRGQHNYWRKYDKDDEGDWRSSEQRSSDRLGNRGSWRNSSDRDKREVLDRNPNNRNTSSNSRSGPSPHKNHHSWKEPQGSRLPEWSMEESNENDTLGTFDSSGAFLETKNTENCNQDDIYISDDADEGFSKDSPEANKTNVKKIPKTPPNSTSSKSTSKKKATNSPKEKSTDNQHAQVSPELPKLNSPNSKSEVSPSSSNSSKLNTNTQSQHHQTVNKEPEFSPVSHQVASSANSKTSKIEGTILLTNVRNSENATPTSSTAEEDTFAHHKKATENMVAQWTEEEEQSVSQTADIPAPHEKETKWFYRDPQGDIQGPFTSPEMFEWFNAGYFTMNLQLRRSYDEKFSELGDLIKAWGGVPFVLNKLPPPFRVPTMATNLTPPITQTSLPTPPVPPTSSQLPKQEELLALQRQLYQQQLMQQQLIMRQQAQMQAFLAQVQKQDNFSSLTSQQQQQLLVQHVMAQQQMSRPNLNPVNEQSLIDPLTSLPMPMLGMSAPPVMNDMSLWNTASSSSWPMNLGTSQPPGASIWDVDLTKPIDEESEKQKKLAEEQEKIRKSEELRLEQERELEEKRMQEELKRQQEKRIQEELRKQEEARIRKELQKQEEEKKRLEELKRQQEEQKRLEERRILEEKRRKEEEMKRQEELRIQEELKRLEELKKQEELKRLEELRKQEELKRQEELRKQEELRQEEIRRMQEKKLEEKRKKEEEKKRQAEKEQERLLELEQQKEVLRLKEIERERVQAERKEREQQELARKLAEMKLRSQGPVWGMKNAEPEAELSLVDIQRLQEEKEREEREERMRLQALQQQTVKQVQQNKNGLSWAKRATDGQPAVKSLFEIQQEEQERLAFVQRTQKPQPPAPILNANVGVWGNTSHLNKITAPPQTWNTTNNSTAAFWDDVISNNPQTHTKKQPQKSNDNSAFPALANRVQQPNTLSVNKSKNVRAKKEEDALTRLFGSHHKPTDEFTKWCTDAISSMPSSVDVPTFVAFLKDIESPYEVFDYVKSYLGEGKEPREFAKQFLEKRSKFRNQAKQTPSEENTLWGPAPAITPIVNKPSVQNSNDCDGNSNGKGKPKRKKNRMQKLDSSMLGFTVNPNPDRLNVGEIDHVDGV